MPTTIWSFFLVKIFLHNKKKIMSCNKCGKEYLSWRWCKPCQIDNLKGIFTKWTSKNKKIDDLIQEMQLKINHKKDIVFEWIPYNQFSDIEEINKGNFATVYL